MEQAIADFATSEVRMGDVCRGKSMPCLVKASGSVACGNLEKKIGG
jgi:hypothetical protein